MTGTELLKAILPIGKWYYLKARKRIVVRGKKYKYVILNDRRMTEVHKLKGGVKGIGSACVQLDRWAEGKYCAFPWEDKMAAEYLLLINDEQEWLRTANIKWLSRPEGG